MLIGVGDNVSLLLLIWSVTTENVSKCTVTYSDEIRKDSVEILYKWIK